MANTSLFTWLGSEGLSGINIRSASSPKGNANPIAKKTARKAPTKAARGYSDADERAVMDNPELSDAELAGMKPFVEVFPDLSGKIRRRPARTSPPGREDH